jgi:DNA-binding CsgD family transcriptional regulator/PAS domain-containing protein
MDAPLHDIVAEIYLAAVDGDQSRTFASKLAHAFRCESCMVYFRSSTQARDTGMPSVVGIWSTTANFDDKACAAYADYYHLRNEWYARTGPQANTSVVLGDELIPTRQVLRTEWADYLQMTHTRHLLGLQVPLDSGLIGMVGLHRGPSASSFEETDRAQMSQLMPHIRSAMQLREKLNLAERKAGLFEDLLDGLSVAVVMVAADGQILFANRAAEAQLNSGEGLGSSHGHLRPQHPRQARVLAQLVHAAASGRHIEHAGGQITLLCAHGPNLPVLVAPLPRANMQLGNTQPAAVVLFGDRRRSGIMPATLARRFGLTPAEAQLLSRLVEGDSIADHAHDRDVSIDTIRSHLKQLFAKTGQRRQSDLIRLVLSDPLARLSLR